MEGEGHAVPIGRAQVLGPLVVKASAAVSSAAEMTAPSTSMACGQPAEDGQHGSQPGVRTGQAVRNGAQGLPL